MMMMMMMIMMMEKEEKKRGTAPLILTSALDGGERLTSRPASIPLGKNAEPIEQEAGQAPEVVWKFWRKKSCPYRHSTFGLSIPKPSYYTACKFVDEHFNRRSTILLSTTGVNISQTRTQRARQLHVNETYT
jgi:hypothetical protein